MSLAAGAAGVEAAQGTEGRAAVDSGFSMQAPYYVPSNLTIDGMACHTLVVPVPAAPLQAHSASSSAIHQR